MWRFEELAEFRETTEGPYGWPENAEEQSQGVGQAGLRSCEGDPGEP